MTDYEELVALFTRRGIPFEKTATAITLHAQNASGRVDGYTGFWTDFHFSPEGDLTSIGIWE